MEKERSFTAIEAQEAWLKSIEKLKLSYNVECFGNGKILSHSCNLIPVKALPDYLNPTLKGGGKGLLPEQSKLSAKFEALEHYLESSYNNSQIEKIILSLNEIEQQKIPLLKDEPESDFYNEIPKDKKISWIKFNSMTQLNQYYYFPLAFFDPYYSKENTDEINYSSFYYLSTNSGSSIGCSKEEALIHGISELIERDSISLFLIKTFLSDMNIKVIDKSSLPQNIIALYKAIEEESNSEIILIDLESQFKVKTFAAFIKNDQDIIPYEGYGASLSPVYAIERALLECLQTFHMTKLNDSKKLRRENLLEFSKHQKAAITDIFEIINEGHCDLVKFNPSNEEELKLSSTSYLKNIVDDIKEKNFDILEMTAYEFDSGITLIKCYMPKMECYYAVQYGYLPLIKERGQVFLTSHN